MEEFSSIYVFHLRGNQRTSGEESRREGGKIFGSGSRAPIAISLLVKKKNSDQNGQIKFHDIGDYLSREDKLNKIEFFGSILGITDSQGWKNIEPDQHGDWLRQRDTGFEEFIPLSESAGAIFDVKSNGVQTNRDDWAVNMSRKNLVAAMQRTISFYNLQVDLHGDKCMESGGVSDKVADKYIDKKLSKIKWTRSLKNNLCRRVKVDFDENKAGVILYRPYSKSWIYYDRVFNEYYKEKISPDAKNSSLCILVTGVGAQQDFSCLMTNVIPDVQLMSNGQCFPLFYYKKNKTTTKQKSMFEDAEAFDEYIKVDGLSDDSLGEFRLNYSTAEISKDDVFYYVYGVLHSQEYTERFSDNLGKELPRIPRVKTAADFWAFSKAGRKLADLHLNYEKVQKYPLQVGGGLLLTDADYRVEKMKYGGKGRGKDQDRTMLVYNHKITVTGIPLEAYEYVVNGKPALDWVVERQCVKTDTASGIVNDANDWAIETMNNPRYPLELFQRVVTVSVETMRIVKSLPRLDIA